MDAKLHINPEEDAGTTKKLLSPETARAALDIKAQLAELEASMSIQQAAERDAVAGYETVGPPTGPALIEPPDPWEPRNGRLWFNTMDERMRKEIALAQVYASEYGHGTAGHNRLILMDGMAKMLDAYQARIADLEAGPGRDPFTVRRVLNVRYNPQWGYDAKAHKKDCGPAGLEMLAEYHTEVDKTTDDIMRYITRGVDRATGLGELQRAATHLYGLNLKRYNGATVYDLIGWLDAGRPALILIWYGGYELRLDRGFTGGHYWVVVGYEQIQFEGEVWTRFIIHDPDYYGARHVVSGAFMPVSMAQFSYVWDNAHRAWDNPDNVALVATFKE